ncbi:hypothetical protein MAR_018527 [Mya arenaria]|uniref:Uncharacterized protein n=1 Tax=Mya arenaria TaxID=6604 RepID=A0ABY7EJI4_MYAAR|nr:hypothetical protein MAR_018527 [Mya arenaria]
MADCSKTRIMAIVLGVVCVAFAVVIAVFIYRELRHRDSTEKKINAENINSFFPAYFRSPEEQRSVAFMAPTKRINVNGLERKLLQFATKKQYFAVHSCTALLNCGGCHCSQENGMYVGVAVKDGVVDPDDLDDIELDFFYFDGCCKCING